MLEEIVETFEFNIQRVENLTSLYLHAGQGRRTTNDTDILRAALVLLHASLEEFLRSLLRWKVPIADQEIVDRYTLIGLTDRKAGKFSLGALVAHRNKTVDELIKESVTAALEQWSSFNNLGEIKTALRSSGIPEASLLIYDFGEIPSIIERRHNIVHKADRNDVMGGRGNHRVKSIGPNQMARYIGSTKSLIDFVQRELGQHQ